MIIRKTSDKISLKIGELVVKISPLTQLQKAEVNNLLASGDLKKTMQGTSLALKYSLKDIEGITNEDGTKYVLEKDENDNLKDSIIDDMLNAPFSDKIVLIAYNLLNGIPTEFVDPETGEKIKGVDFVGEGTSEKK